MNINKLINDFKKYDSATVQNAMILVRGYVDANEDYTSPDLKSYNFYETIVGVAVTGKVTPLNEPQNKIESSLSEPLCAHAIYHLLLS